MENCSPDIKFQPATLSTAAEQKATSLICWKKDQIQLEKSVQTAVFFKYNISGFTTLNSDARCDAPLTLSCMWTGHSELISEDLFGFQIRHSQRHVKPALLPFFIHPANKQVRAVLTAIFKLGSNPSHSPFQQSRPPVPSPTTPLQLSFLLQAWIDKGTKFPQRRVDVQPFTLLWFLHNDEGRK